MMLRVQPQQIVFGGHWGGLTLQRKWVQSCEHPFQPRHLFGMTRRGDMGQAGRVGQQSGCHISFLKRRGCNV